MTLRDRYLNPADTSYVRSRKAYQMKCVENRTLRAVGAELGVSRERARQLVRKFKTTYLSRERWFTRRNKPLEMRDLKELNVTRLTRFISYNRMESMRISHFLEHVQPAEVVRQPNTGIQTMRLILQALEEVGYDVAHIRTTRNWKNYNTPEHLREGPRRGCQNPRYRLFSLYPEGCDGSEGACREEIQFESGD
jgi:hypothetical protein|tara:strand:- start:654 stop:1235 length:582 start_codon:yes stop_codon:yes gene_type:complete